MEISFTVIGRPQQRGSKKVGLVPKRGGGYLEKNGRPIVVARDDNDKSKAWMDSVKCVCYGLMRNKELLRGPVELRVVFYFKRPEAHYGSGRNADQLKPSAPSHHAQSPDLDKLVRCLGDAMTGVVYTDDKLICRTTSSREWTTTTERAEVTIVELSAVAKPVASSQLGLGLD